MPGSDSPASDVSDARTRCGPVPVITVCALADPVRAAAAGSLLIDLEGGIQVSYEVLVGRDLLRRRVSDTRRVIDDVFVPMRHDCVCCSLTDELVPTLEFWAEYGRPLLLVLPPSVEPAEIVRALVGAAEAKPLLQVAQVAVAVDSETLEADLFGDDLLVERGLSYGELDRRAVGECLAHQIEFADRIVYEATASRRVRAIFDHLVGGVACYAELHRTDGTALLKPRMIDDDLQNSDACGDLSRDWRGNPSYAMATGAPDRQGIWTVELQSNRPFSPYRLQVELERLAAGKVRGRGRFWVPTRPRLRCAWDSAGGQLSIGPAGWWVGPPESYLVITGADGNSQDVREAFERALLTDAELMMGEAVWLGDDDGLDLWLGERAQLA